MCLYWFLCDHFFVVYLVSWLYYYFYYVVYYKYGFPMSNIVTLPANI